MYTFDTLFQGLMKPWYQPTFVRIFLKFGAFDILR